MAKILYETRASGQRLKYTLAQPLHKRIPQKFNPIALKTAKTHRVLAILSATVLTYN